MFSILVLIVFPSLIVSTHVKEMSRSEHDSDIVLVVRENEDITELWSANVKFGGISTLQSRINGGDSHRLEDVYTQLMAMITEIHQSPNNVLNLGLGGGCLPRFHLMRYRNAQVTSVEIDESVIRLHSMHFKRSYDEPRHDIVHQCGYAFLENDVGISYDVIWTDVYERESMSNELLVPRIFKTSDFVRLAKRRLNYGGLLVINLSRGDYEQVHTLFTDAFPSCIVVRASQSVVVAAVSDSDSSLLNCEKLHLIHEEWIERGHSTLYDIDCKALAVSSK